MKIGVLTLPLKGNYGGVLQAYALVSFLKMNGHDAYLVDRQWDARRKKTLVYYIQKFVFHDIIIKNVKNFCNERIYPKTQRIDSQDGMKILEKEKFDAFVVGSDQVWRLEHIGGVKNNYFLDFVGNDRIKKIAYAASFGKDTVDGDVNKFQEISELLKQFTAISVREDSGVKICKEIFNVDATHVLDPVLLVDKAIFEPIIEQKYRSKLVNTLTAYVLDDTNEKLAIISAAAKNLNLKIKSVNYRKDPAFLLENKSLDIYNYVYPPVENWLRGFRDAEFVITDSFHGMMFSIAFNKQFFVIGNEKRGFTRFTSFLHEFGLSNRLITSANPFDESMLEKKIDYDLVNKKLDDWKIKSRLFLLNALNK